MDFVHKIWEKPIKATAVWLESNKFPLTVAVLGHKPVDWAAQVKSRDRVMELFEYSMLNGITVT